MENFRYFKELLDSNNCTYDVNELKCLCSKYLNNNDMSKCIILSRVSTTQQDLDQQSNVLIEEAKRCGYKKNNIILIENKESAIKNDLSERQGLQQVIELINNDKKIDSVFIYEISRLARRSVVLYEMRDFFIEHKIQLICLKPYFKLLEDGKMSHTAGIVFSLMGVLAESEMMIKKERFMRAKNDLKSQGKKSAGSVKFGYRKTKDKYVVIDEFQSVIVNEIYDHYIEDERTSLYETYIWASGKWPEFFPIKPYKYCQHRVRNILTEQIYVDGNWCYKPFIDPEKQRKAKEKMNGARCRARFHVNDNYLGRGLLYCKTCGRMLTPCGGRTAAYICPTNKEHNVTINSKNIDNLIWDEARVLANINSNINYDVKISELGEQLKELENIRKNIVIEKNKVISMQEKLVSKWLEGKINDEIYDNKNDEIIEKIKKLDKDINGTDKKIVEVKAILEGTKDVMEAKPIIYDDVKDNKVKIDIIRKYINKVWVEKNKKLEYNISFEYKNCIVIQKGEYLYRMAGGHMKLLRYNADGTVDRII